MAKSKKKKNNSKNVINKKFETVSVPETENKTDNKTANKKTDNKAFPKKLFDMIGLKTKMDYVVCSIGAVIVLALVILAILLFSGVFQTKESRAATVKYYGRDESDLSASLISSTEEEQKIMSDEMQLDFDNARFDFYALTELDYTDANTTLPMSLANPSYNKYVLVFTITNGEGEILYRSLGVRPGYMLTYISLSRNIPYGENELKLYVTAFKEKESKEETTYKKVGNSIATLKLNHTASIEPVEAPQN